MPGEHQIVIEYDYLANTEAANNRNQGLPKAANDGQTMSAVLQVFWSSDKFTLEPLPADVLFVYADELPYDDSFPTKQKGPTEQRGQTEQAPTALGSHDSDQLQLAELIRQHDGKLLADAFRCDACHQSLSSLSTLAAPDLSRVRDGGSFQQLVSRIQQPASVVSNSRMPHFDFTTQQAEQIAAFVWSRSEKPRSDKRLKSKDGDVAAGATLLLSTGCAACHQLPAHLTSVGAAAPSAAAASGGAAASSAADDDGSQPLAVGFNAVADSAHAGPSLTSVAAVRSAGWLNRWLQDPASLNPSHRMPVFALTDDERRQIVAALTASAKPPAEVDRQDSEQISAEQISAEQISAEQISAEQISPEQIEAGRRLTVQFRCSSCHEISGLERVRDHQSALKEQIASDTELDGAGSCLRAAGVAATKPSIPRFHLSDSQTAALRSWMNQVAPILASASGPHESAFARAELLLQRNQCLSCHDRDQVRGLSAAAGVLEQSLESLRGRSQALVPPSLTAVGDKLNDDYLRIAVAGKHQTRRLPWLDVRMPEFKHTKQETADLVHYFVSSDRLPDSADSVRPEIAAAAKALPASAQDLLLGNQLTGAGGFNCVACHQAGSFEPRNVALGTRGSDLLTMGSRIRPRFFQRWMKNPIRVVAGIEMPAIKRAAPGVLDDDLNRQMATIWRAISDPGFTAPTVVSRYEQFVNVEPGQPPRVIRDVFTIGEDKQRDGVARALAVGFGNGHNLLIDLDTLQLRQWTVGEFARQRTEGKSWFWSTAGINVVTQPAVTSNSEFLFHLVREPIGRQAGAGDNLGPSSSTSAAATASSVEGLPPVEDEGRMAELLRYSTDQDGVTLWYRIHYPVADNRSAPAGSSSASGNPHHAITAWNDPDNPVQSVTIRERIDAVEAAGIEEDATTGWARTFELLDGPADTTLIVKTAAGSPTAGGAVSTARLQFVLGQGAADDVTSAAILTKQRPVRWQGTVDTLIPRTIPPSLPSIVTSAEAITSLPGFQGTRLPFSGNIMPTAMAWLPDGRMVFTSLKGHVWIASDADGDGLEDQLSLFEEGLAAPFGILADGDSILVAHKPEVLRLTDTDGDGRADLREVVGAGWGMTDDYHDWTSGLVRDDRQNLFVGIGSDYSQKNRPQNRDRWRGTVLQIDPSGVVTPMADAFRYPMGLAFDHAGRLYATDNQGVQNTFNEINHIERGKHYGVPSRHFADESARHETPALQIPHPWTRSVNSILFFPRSFSEMGLSGHGLGCEYDLRYLIRFTVQEVDGIMQGASYPFSLPDQEAGGSNFIGPICSAVSPNGDLYIGSIWDSGWQGGPNTGGITRLTPQPGRRSNGIQQVEATANGFRIRFFESVDRTAAMNADSYSIQGYTRIWGGSYATPDSDQHQCSIEAVQLADDGRTVDLTVAGRKPGYLYDITIAGNLREQSALWPSEAHYFLKRIPGNSPTRPGDSR